MSKKDKKGKRRKGEEGSEKRITWMPIW